MAVNKIETVYPQIRALILVVGSVSCRIESQELSQPEGGLMVGIPKNRKLLAEIKVTLEIDGDRSDRSRLAGLTEA